MVDFSEWKTAFFSVEVLNNNYQKIKMFPDCTTYYLVSKKCQCLVTPVKDLMFPCRSRPELRWLSVKLQLHWCPGGHFNLCKLSYTWSLNLRCSPWNVRHRNVPEISGMLPAENPALGRNSWAVMHTVVSHSSPFLHVPCRWPPRLEGVTSHCQSPNHSHLTNPLCGLEKCMGAFSTSSVVNV